VRHWSLGYPLSGFAPVAGRPCRGWIELFLLSHRPTARGWAREAWPDGGPLLDQSWALALLFRAIGDELGRIEAEQARRRSRR
jgi:hypothetical protein